MLLVVGVAALFVMLLISGLVWWTALLAILGIFLVAWLLAYQIFGSRSVLRFGHKLHWKKCRFCTGGAQWLHSRTNVWGPIPQKIRIIQDGNEFFEPPQGNIRTCPNCQLGGHWYEPRPIEPDPVPESNYDTEGNEIEW